MHIYKMGQVVFERMRPNQKLIVVSVDRNIYSCVDQERPWQKAFSYHERDLNSDLKTKENAKISSDKER